ncbi:ribosomal protein L14 (mitochondrion) [Fonticula alba]|uniref:Ribosomal protein L14 n=1 Tax=Fonticula alba TaxID=691883 RepID=A0A058YZ69_FONAL|nr:ribosomal protein L14 [Fonticula alba]KCV67176.1 ribosomal protein L14 [Fonticula alba]|eukprot:XP_009498417.1 ribosomal protein L14 (mitochondrion) [Fonticula alba]
MITFLTNLKIADNTGVLNVQCIKVLGGHKMRVAISGKPIVTALKKVRPRKKFKKGEVAKVLVLSTKNRFRRNSGFIINSNKNTGLILNDGFAPVANRVTGAVPHEVRAKYNRGYLLTRKNY